MSTKNYSTLHFISGKKFYYCSIIFIFSFQDCAVAKMWILLFGISENVVESVCFTSRLSVLLPGHQTKNTRAKKRGTISSTWLEKYKPELPSNAHHSEACTDNLVENEPESKNVPANKVKPVEKGLDDGNSSSGHIKNSCLSIEGLDLVPDMINPQNTSIEVGNNREKSAEVKSVTKSQECTKGRHSNQEHVESESKQSDGEKNLDDKCLNGNPRLEVSDLCQASKKCADVLDSITVTKPITSSSVIERTDPDPRDFLQEVVSKKRKDEGSTLDKEKPSKKLKIESDNEEEVIFDESKV